MSPNPTAWTDHVTKTFQSQLYDDFKNVIIL